jgi:PAS domain-containing protein
VSQDINTRKRIEDTLRASEAGLRLSQEAGHIGTWDWDLARGHLNWSDLQYQQLSVGRAMRNGVTGSTLGGRDSSGRTSSDRSSADPTPASVRLTRPVLGLVMMTRVENGPFPYRQHARQVIRMR